MKPTHPRTKYLLSLLALVLVSVGVCACGSSNKATSTSASVGNATTAPTTQPTPTNPVETQNGGHPATEPDKREITALVNHYYAAAVADNGAAACALLTAAMIKSVPEDYGQDPSRPYLQGKTCKVVLTKLFRHPHNVTVADFATTRVVGVHIDNSGNKGLAHLDSSMMHNGEMGVELEHGVWKVDVPIGAVN